MKMSGKESADMLTGRKMRAQADEIIRLRECLQIMWDWAHNWDSPFLQDDEWAEVDGPKIKSALADSK